MVAPLIRAITYASLFVGVVLVFLPARVLEWSGVTRPANISPWNLLGVVLAASGAPWRPRAY
jgi:hypothetical protein